jgi:hypothetical protein
MNVMEFKFEKLIIWQKAMDFGEIINAMVFNLMNMMTAFKEKIK